jgi:hypothetical protein
VRDVVCDLESPRESADEPEPEAEAGAVGARGEADPLVTDDHDELAVLQVGLDNERTDRCGAGIGMHDDVGARLRDGERDVVQQRPRDRMCRG